MEVLLRAFYVGKQVKLYDAPFGQTLLDTVPTRMNPRFRMLLALAFGTFCGVNAGRMYITQNLLNFNYASWMGLVWNGFHALKWALLQKHFKLWGEIEAKEIIKNAKFELMKNNLKNKKNGNFRRTNNRRISSRKL